jgi:DnaJ domain
MPFAASASRKLITLESFQRHIIICWTQRPAHSSLARRSFRAIDNNPYRILNVPVNSDYETVKAAFLKAALKHHPDHSKQADTAAFVRVRQAFEEIVYNKGGSNEDDASSSSSTKKTVWKSDAEFQAWFRAATGEFLSFDMNHQTRQEVIRVYRTMSSGGKDKGGYWEMARQLAEREDAVGSGNDNSAPMGQLTAAGQSLSSNLRRKRNR